uniref:Mitochondrial import inner membrane translocase subunit Tim21 n=1 Tax=Rhizophora mucronata TaxID=61149 RepID=A0A2P2KUF4_RHIMU
MQRMWRSTTSLRSSCCSGLLGSQYELSSVLERKHLKRASDVGLAAFSSLAATQNAAALGNSAKQGILRDNGFNFLCGGQQGRHNIVGLLENHGASNATPFSARFCSSRASKKNGETPSETKKDVSTVEDPFDAPTYNIPEKPLTFTEGASYSVIILAGLGVAAVAGYAVFKELIFEPKEYRIFNKALKRIQDDSQVRVRIGSPITGYGQESRNRAARQRIPNKIYTDEDGVEHVQVVFYIRGPHGAGRVSAEMFKDKVDREWRYTYLIVQFMQPSQSQLILESYMPAPAPVPA